MFEALSDRERTVVELAAGGLTDQGIASRLGISLFTVRNYWTRIRSKVGDATRAELVAKMLQETYKLTLQDTTTSFQKSVDALLQIEDLVTQQERALVDEVLERCAPEDRAAVAEARKKVDVLREEARGGHEHREVTTDA